MATVFSPNIIEIAVIHELFAKPAVNVWHMWFDSELGTDTKTDVVGDFRDNWQDHVLSLAAADLVLVQFEWRSLDAGDGELGTILPDPAKPTTGSADTVSLPPNCASLIRKTTSDRLRGQRDGRTFLGGVPDSATEESGAYAPAHVAAADVILASFYNGISDTSGAASGDRYPAVLNTTAESRAKGPQPVTITSRRVTSISLDPMIATQRDRLR